MNDSSAALAVLTGLAVRLMIPILITGFIVLVLARLDRRWQTEGSADPWRVKKPECWKTQHCPAGAARTALLTLLICLPAGLPITGGYLNESVWHARCSLAAPVPANG
jgi:hypothetical protein